ncbi:AAA family ATPase [uncultured Maritimibacter sp.]|uniref:AAA family ATPase n=1 Tax=uncultured Maritimibacter sp. TaxID=991866 RepID=UPI00259294F1|nr:AAA family ATPase [uncultured Maritimibacter sp.]
MTELAVSPRFTDADLPVAAPKAARTRTLMLSGTPGMAEMVARGLAQDANLDVRHKPFGLADYISREDADLTGLELLVFEIRPGNDTDIAIIRELKRHFGDDLQILGVTGEALTLATARTLMEAGVAEVIPLSNTQPQADHAASLGALTTQAETTGGETRDAMVLAVCGAAGGVGTTTFALNLATLLARPDKTSKGEAARVAVVDLDFQNGVLGASIDLTDGGAYLEMLQGQASPNQSFLKRALESYAPGGFDVMAAPVTLAPLDAMTPDMVARLIDELRLAYDYVVLDLPRVVVDWIDAVLARADRFFILGDTSVHTVRQIRRMIDLYTDDHAALPVQVVVSKEKKPGAAHVKEAEHFLGQTLATWLPRDDKTAARARAHGQPMALSGQKAPVSRAMGPVVDQIRTDFKNSNRRRA